MKMTRLLIPALLILSLAGCQSAPKKDLALERAKAQLEQLQSDKELTGYAPLAVGEAERALRAAEQATTDHYRTYLIYMAEKQIQIARTMAQREQLEQTYSELERERARMQVRASKLETEQARKEAAEARLMYATTAEEAERQRRERDAALEAEAETARDAEMAREEAAQALRLAESRASEAELARREATLASQQVDTLTRQLENLQLRQTESGVVVTLGDVLFATGQVELLDGARSSLVEVVDLLQTEPDKKIRIEGHTDSTGDAEANLRLSQQRADAVMAALVELGVNAERLTSVGMGEDYPIASNDTEEGRGQNRRVDVILLDNQ